MVLGEEKKRKGEEEENYDDYNRPSSSSW
jgi:hypothetical protein